MTLKTWILDLDGIEHTVELEHKYGSGKRSIMVDGQVVFQSSRLIDTLFDIGSTHPIEIAGHSVLVIIRTNGMSFTYDLAVDNHSLSTGREVKPLLAVPIWGWVCIIACLSIIVISLGGIIPIVLGCGGTAVCLRYVRDPHKSERHRLLICSGTTMITWALFIYSIVAVSALQLK